MFAYHGLVPKLIQLSPGEQVLLNAHSLGHAAWLSRAAGVSEILLAIVLVVLPRLAWPLLLSGAILLALLIDVAVVQPSMLMDAFNPVTLNASGIALCLIGWLTRKDGRLARRR